MAIGRNASREKSRPAVAVDLFAGAGGLAEGLLKAGLHVAASVELHPQPALTHAFNHAGTSVLVGDIRDLDLRVLDSAIAESAGQRGVDVVVGGPPCQGFSSAGKKSVTDPRNSLFRHFVRVIDHLQPQMFLMENVPGFRSMYQGRVYAEALRAFTSLGYETTDDIIVTARYGVPQRRKRFVMVGWRTSGPRRFQWPGASHQAEQSDSLFGGVDPFVSAGAALDDLAFLEPGWEATRYVSPASSSYARDRRNNNELVFNHLATRHRAKAVTTFELIPIGGSIRDVDPQLRSKKLTMTRLDPERISNTIVSLADDLLHYAHHRILTVREMARLQTFDDDFVFIGKRTSGFVERRVDVPQYTQVGNAVPPVLGEVLGRALVQALGAPEQDLRDLDRRRARHQLVCGSSGYAGYLLAPEAKDDIVLRDVRGESIELPIADSEPLVVDQPPLRDWTASPNPRRGQWAPGVTPRDRPSWAADTGARAGGRKPRRS